MPTTPPLTVAIPTFNGARHITEALRGILDQSREAFDLIVSDDRSDDDTLSIIRTVAGDRAHIEVNSERLGLAGNWNRCVERARTPLVAIFHQDDVMLPGHLAAHRGAFEAHPDAGFICGPARVLDANGRPVPDSVVGRDSIGPHDRIFPPGAFVRELAWRNPVRCSAVTIRKAAHRAVGGFDRRFRYAVDWEFWLRIAREFEVLWLGRPTVAMRWHPASETHRFTSGTADLDEQRSIMESVLRDDADPWPDAAIIRRRMRRRLGRAYLNRAYVASRAGDAGLTRRALAASIGLSPALLGNIVLHPRLLARLAAGLLAAPDRPRQPPPAAL